MKKTFYPILSVIIILAFAFLVMYMLYGSGVTPIFMIMAIFIIILGAAILTLVWPHFSGTKTLDTGKSPFMISRGVYIMMVITLFASFLFQGFNSSSEWSFINPSENPLFPIAAITIIAGLYLILYLQKSVRKKYSFLELWTMKANDEREQHIIDDAARKTYAFMRILAVIVGLGFFALQLLDISFPAFSVGYILFLFIFIAHAYFMFLLRKITN